MADIPLSNALSSGPRRATYVLTSSNASFPIPTWAQGGKGIVYVTGCGGGASGGINTVSGTRGVGGGSAGQAIGLPMLIPAGVTTASVVIGAGGAALTGTAATGGNSGGETSVYFGQVGVSLTGGLAGTATQPPNVASAVFAALNPVPNSTLLALRKIGALSSSDTYLQGGIAGGDDGNADQGFGAGASGYFGTGGAGVSPAPTANTSGQGGQGYGSGGAGALWLSGGAVTSGKGADGFVSIEFVEGL